MSTAVHKRIEKYCMLQCQRLQTITLIGQMRLLKLKPKLECREKCMVLVGLVMASQRKAFTKVTLLHISVERIQFFLLHIHLQITQLLLVI